MKTKYVAVFSVSGYVEVEVEAENEQEAKTLAYEKLDTELKNGNIKLESVEADIEDFGSLDDLEE